MSAEDFEQDFFNEEKDFAAANFSLEWAFLSVPFLFFYMFFMTGFLPAFWATAGLITIYIIFILIDLRFS